MKKLTTLKNENKQSHIFVNNKEVFIVEFYENNKRVGEIEYTNKSYHYVSDAAENWVTGILAVDTIKHYGRVAA
jgi:hypothetical protein